MKPGFAVSAEVLEIRIPLSDSLISLAVGSLLLGLDQSLGKASPAVVEEENGPFQSTFIVHPGETEISTIQPRQEPGSTNQPVTAPTLTTAANARNEVLPAVIDDLLTSSLHEPVVQSPEVSSQAGSPPPFLGAGESAANQNSSSRGSAGNASSGAPPAGLGNTHPSTGTPIIEASSGLDSETSAASGPAVPTTQAPAASQHGEIQPLQIEKQSEPADGTFFALTSSGGSGGNEAPWAEDDYYSILHDTALNESSPGVLGNDWDGDGDPLDAVLDSGPSFASSFTFNSDGSFDYEPIANWSGTDSFTYHASDGLDDSLTATVTIDVTNEVPWADDDYYSILHDTTLIESSPGVLGNDWDGDGDPISATLDVGPTNGTLSYFNSDGSFEYVPNANWSGTDSFTYHVNDVLEDSNIATVTIDVTNELPYAEDDYYSILHDTTLIESSPGVLGNDWDGDGDDIYNSATLDVGPTNGMLSYFNSDGSFEYVPNANWSGTDSFTYHISDGLGDSNIATVTIDVTNQAPYADGQFFTILQGTTLRRPIPGVLANDWDDDNDPLTANLVTDVSNGSLTLNEDGSFSYTPFSQFLGIDSFTYVASDGLDQSFEATVEIEVIQWSLNIRLDSNNDTDYFDPDDELVEMDDPGMVFGTNDDDDNQNGIIDSSEAPFLIDDANGNSVPIDDDDLVKAELEYGDHAGLAEGDKEGLQLQLTSSSSDIKIWSSTWKQYNLTGAKFVFGADQIPRWQAPDESQHEFPSVVYLEGKNPGTATIALALLDNMNAQMDDDKAKATDVRVDIDIDSNNNGTINNAPNAMNAEDFFENAGLLPGNLINYNFNDTVQGVDHDLELATISYDAGGADLTGFKLLLNHGAGVKLWLTQSKDPLPDENVPNTNRYVWTIGNPNITIPTSIYIEGIIVGSEHIGFSIHRPNADLDGLELPPLSTC